MGIVDVDFDQFDNDYKMIHFYKNNKTLEKDKKKMYSIKIKDKNMHYIDHNSIFREYGFTREPLPLAFRNNRWVCYIGNRRGWRRTTFLKKFRDIHIIWNWRKQEWILAEFHKPIKEHQVGDTLNSYRWALCTYDNKWIQWEADVVRIATTVNAWTLPIIDKRCWYDIPKEFHNLLVDSKEDLYMLQKMSVSERVDIIKRLQEYYRKRVNYQEAANKFNDIISSW